MRFTVVTILPELIEPSLAAGVVGRARDAGTIAVATINPRDFTSDRHRTVDDTPYGGGPGSAHNFTTGLLTYHYLTGDPLARDAVVSLADWVVRMDDGRLNVLGLIDAGPTGLASFTLYLDYHGPGRGDRQPAPRQPKPGAPPHRNRRQRGDHHPADQRIRG